MMHRCSSNTNMVGTAAACSCGMYHSQSNSFSMVFSMSNNGGGQYYRGFDQEEEMHSFTTSSSSSVDCTLSLGTPSTRLTNINENANHHQEKKRSSCMSNFGWNILPSKQTPPPPPSAPKSHRGGGNSNANSGGDPLLARRCANCDTTSTPLWRNGPRGPKSLCNACGIRFKKEERRAAAASSNGGGVADTQQMMNGSWVQAQKMAYYSPAYGNEFRFIEDDDDHRDSDTAAGVPYLSWRFNVPDRPGLVHDFTR